MKKSVRTSHHLPKQLLLPRTKHELRSTIREKITRWAILTHFLEKRTSIKASSSSLEIEMAVEHEDISENGDGLLKNILGENRKIDEFEQRWTKMNGYSQTDLRRTIVRCLLRPTFNNFSTHFPSQPEFTRTFITAPWICSQGNFCFLDFQLTQFLKNSVS